MTTENKKDIRQKILDGIEKAYQKLVETKKKTGEQIVVSKNGEVVIINPNEI